MKFLIFVILFHFWIESFTQNLVPNSDFELYTSCPINSGELYKLFNWMDPTGATSDYYNTCGSGGANVPYCGNGFQNSVSGNGYAGIWAYNGVGNNFREYVAVELTSVLLPSRCYRLEFYVNLHNYSGYAIKQLGMILTDTLLTVPNFQDVLNYTPTIESKQILSDTILWNKISAYYTSVGGEKYLTIGNFRTDSQIDTISIQGNTYPGAYYLIENVLVEEIPGCDTLGIIHIEDENVLEIFPNPSNGLLNINNLQDKNGLFIIYDLSGNEVFSSTILKKSSNQFHLDLSVGMYLYRILYSDDSSDSGKLSIIE